MSEALRLADALEQQFPIGTAQHYLDGEAAAELRRLHAENEALKADLIKQGWRQCAKGQRTTQWCGVVEKAVQAEREQCAKLAWATQEPEDEYVSLREAIAAAIRSRK